MHGCCIRTIIQKACLLWIRTSEVLKTTFLNYHHAPMFGGHGFKAINFSINNINYGFEIPYVMASVQINYAIKIF